VATGDRFRAPLQNQKKQNKDWQKIKIKDKTDQNKNTGFDRK
jgi:hypothetical protein